MMLFSVIPFGCTQAVLTILIMSMMEETYLLSLKLIVTAHTGSKRGYQVSRHRDWRQNEEKPNLKGRESAFLSLHDSTFLDIARGGGSTDKSKNLANEEASSTTIYTNSHEPIRDDIISSQSKIISIGFIDLSATASYFASLNSSIILLVDEEATNADVTVDEILLRTQLLSLFENEPHDVSVGISPGEMKAYINMILESFALICDVLVVRIGEQEILAPESMSYVIRGNRQRKLAGMAWGKLWLCATNGPGHTLHRLNSKKFDGCGDVDDDDNSCKLETSTWSILFSSREETNRNFKDANEVIVPSPKALFRSFSQQVIQSKHRSILETRETLLSKFSLKSSFPECFPRVSMLYRSKQGERYSPTATSKENGVIKNRTQSPSRYAKNDEISIGTKIEKNDNEEEIGDVIRNAYRKLDNLEEKMQELVLDESSNSMPLLEFRELVENILQTVESQLKTGRDITHSFGKGVMKRITVEVERLYKDQLHALRNYYGQRYESILDEDLENIIDDNEIIERKWAIGAEHLTQAFLAAALNSVPAMYRKDLKENNDGIGYRSMASFDHVDMLQGLIHDMMESTERRKDEKNLASMLVSNEDKDSTGSAPTSISLPKIPKWLERLAARTFVLGVNYIQGWLAWQGIKRAAIERDRNQPKFPLF